MTLCFNDGDQATTPPPPLPRTARSTCCATRCVSVRTAPVFGALLVTNATANSASFVVVLTNANSASFVVALTNANANAPCFQNRSNCLRFKVSYASRLSAHRIECSSSARRAWHRAYIQCCMQCCIQCYIQCRPSSGRQIPPTQPLGGLRLQP